jgi:hypothetical protein
VERQLGNATIEGLPAVAHNAALRELRRHPFFTSGGDGFDRLSEFCAPSSSRQQEDEELGLLSLSVALCQSHAKVRAIEKLLAEAMEALHDPINGAAIPSALPVLLRDTGQQLVALGAHFRASE